MSNQHQKDFERWLNSGLFEADEVAPVMKGWAMHAYLAGRQHESERVRELENALHMMDGPEPSEDRVFTDHGHYCSVVQPTMWRQRKDKSTYPIRYTRTHIIFHKNCTSEQRGMQIRRFHRAADSKDWHLAANPYAGVDLTPEEWKIVMSKALSTGKRDV